MSKNFNLSSKYNLTFDISAGGDKLVIGVYDQDSSTPKVLTMDSDLASDAVEVYAPSSGSRIHVQSGDIIDIAWAIGDFPSYIARGESLRYWYNDNQAAYWTDQPDSLVVGPGDDYLVLVGAGSDLYENYFVDLGSLYWRNINDDLPFSVYTFRRLDWDLEQVQISNNYFYSNDYFIQASFSGGDDFFDITGTISYPVTSIVYG